MALQYRHEWKTEISAADKILLAQRLDALLQRDPHVDENGCYHIRSLYFDNLSDTALREKIDGLAHRKKFRLRYYNGDISRILLEQKCKDNSLGYKLSAPITAPEVQRILDGDWEWLLSAAHPLLRSLGEKMLHEGYRPRTIVDYTREPFIYEAGNVRVTLDYGIRTGLGCVDLLNPDCITIPAKDSPVILEVKWDAFLPDLIRDAIQLPGRRTAAFSKYAACRMYD